MDLNAKTSQKMLNNQPSFQSFLIKSKNIRNICRCFALMGGWKGKINILKIHRKLQNSNFDFWNNLKHNST